MSTVAPPESTRVTVSPLLDSPLGANEKSAVWPATAWKTAVLLLPTKYAWDGITVPTGNVANTGGMTAVFEPSSAMPAVKAQPEMSTGSTPRL